MAPENLVTFREMTEVTKEIKREILDEVNKIDDKVEVVGGKVNQLNDLVIPLTISMSQTADNTKDIAESFKEFTRVQSATNGLFKDTMHNHDLAIEGIRSVTNSITEKKKYNAGVVVAVIGVVGTFVAGLFGLAPYIFN